MDVERAEKRLVLMKNVKPGYMEEYESYENEMQRLYIIFVEKYKNLDYLENMLDKINLDEERHFKET